MGNLRTTLKKLQERAKENPKDSFIFGLSAGFIHDYEGAIESFDRAIYLSFDFEDKFLLSLFWAFKGQAHAEIDQNTEALKSFDKSIELDPSSIGWDFKGTFYHDQEKYEEALECYNKYDEMNDDHNSETDTARADVLSHLGKHNESLKIYSKAVEEDPTDIEALFGKADELSELKKPMDALKVIDEALKIDDDDTDLLLQKSIVLLETKDYDTALEYIEKAITIEPSDEYAWYNKACVLSLMDKKEDALDALFIATSIQPDNVEDMKEESDFDNIKNTSRFIQIASKHS